MTASIDGVRGADPPSSGAAAAAGASAPDPAASSDARSKEQQAKKIRADRSAEDPQQSLLDALGDYMVLCGGDPLEDVRPDPARRPSPPRAASRAPRRGHPRVVAPAPLPLPPRRAEGARFPPRRSPRSRLARARALTLAPPSPPPARAQGWRVDMKMRVNGATHGTYDVVRPLAETSNPATPDPPATLVLRARRAQRDEARSTCPTQLCAAAAAAAAESSSSSSSSSSAADAPNEPSPHRVPRSIAHPLDHPPPRTTARSPSPSPSPLPLPPRRKKYYFNPEGVRFRSRAEAVRHYGLAPVAAPKGPSKSQPGHRSGADAAAFPRRPKPPRPEPYPKVSDRVPRAEAARRVAKAREKKTAPPEAPFHAAEGVKILSLGKVDARPGYHDANHVFPLGFKTEWVNSDKSAVFHSEIVDGVSGEGSAAAGRGPPPPPGPGPTFRVTRTLLSKTLVENPSSDAAGSGAVGPVATAHARGDDDSRASVPLVVEARTSLDAWAKMIVASSGGWGGAESESDAPPHPTAPCGTGDRFALDDPEVIRALEADPFVDVSCGSYQYACQRGNRAEELARRAKYVASCSRELLRVAKEAAAGARARRSAPRRASRSRGRRATRRRSARVMDRLLARVEAAERHEAKRRERDLEREKLEAAKRLERAEKERRRLEEKAEREAAKERERAEKEQRRLEEKAERDAAKERERAEKELKRAALAAQREKDREEREAAKEAAKAERERRREEEARNAERARVEGELAGRWLFGEPARVDDRDAPAASIDPAFLPDARETRAALGAFADDPDPSVAGDALELWAFLDRFREVLFKEPPERDGHALEGRKKTRGIRGGKKTRRGRRRKGGSARKKGAEHALPLVVQLGYDDCRLPREAYPPTPAALADALVSGEPAGGAAVVGALLTPLLASASKAQPSALLAKATALAPVGGDASAHALPGGAWEETLRRYLLGQAAAMETPPTEGLGSTLRAAAEAGELVCRWIVTGGPTALAAPPDASGGGGGGGGSAAAPTPAAAAATAALIEGFPRPAAALSARADAEALARCEIELYALAGDVFERDPDPSNSSRKGGSTSTSAAAVRGRRVEATRLARSACAMPEVRAVRQAVRVLAHEDPPRPPR